MSPTTNLPLAEINLIYETALSNIRQTTLQAITFIIHFKITFKYGQNSEKNDYFEANKKKLFSTNGKKKDIKETKTTDDF